MLVFWTLRVLSAWPQYPSIGLQPLSKFFTYGPQDAPGSPWSFPTSALKSNSPSSKEKCFFLFNKWHLNTNMWAQGVLIVINCSCLSAHSCWRKCLVDSLEPLSWQGEFATLPCGLSVVLKTCHHKHVSCSVVISNSTELKSQMRVILLLTQ